MKQMMLCLSVLVGFSGGVSAASLEQIVKDDIKTLDKLNDECKKIEYYFDYFPSGGIHSVYCHLHKLTLPQLIKLYKSVPVVQSSPHLEKMDFQNTRAFTRYSLAFVRELDQVFNRRLPALIGQDQVKKIYQKTFPLQAQTAYATYKKLLKEREVTELALKEYKRYIQQGKNSLEIIRPFDYLFNPNFPRAYKLFIKNRDMMQYFPTLKGDAGGFEWNMTYGFAGFWMRRMIDGTAQDIFAALERFMMRNDPEFMRNPTKLTRQAP